MEIKGQEKTSKTKKEQAAGSTVGHHVFIGAYTILALGSMTFYVLNRLSILPVSGARQNLFSRIFLGIFIAAVVLFIARVAERIVRKRVRTRSAAYNVVRAIRLLAVFIITFVIISFLNANWYTAAASLGLISLIVGFALQTPIASLIGWFYIVIRNPYKVGDRVQIGDFTGDVVEINYLDTTLWEFGGSYLTNDLSTGRLIRFPNAMVFQSEVYNYSWHKFPLIWNEIPFHVAYESDLAAIELRIREIAKEEIGDITEEHVEHLKMLLKRTAVDELNIKEYPFVNFRVNSNTWIEVLLIYLVNPRQGASIRNRLIKRVLAELKDRPETLFPKSNAR
jgi:small-conductance mechanosensitive channel